MRHALVAAVTFLLSFGAGAAADPAGADAWRGRRHEDVVALLGTPDKTSVTRDGERVLTYKLVRLDDPAQAPSSVLVLTVPGVGTVGRLAPRGAQSMAETSLQPTELDGRGRAIGGGVVSSESGSVTWDSERGEVERSWEERPSISGKVTLKFHVGGDGAITRWSVSPRSAQIDSRPSPGPGAG